jgi:hypothetical protein
MEPIPCEETTHTATERRRLERFDLKLPARIESLPRRADNPPAVLNLITRDISACGAFFPSTDSLEEGTRVKVDLVLTLEKPRSSQVKGALIQVNGTVLRKEPAGMAVDFEKTYRLAPLNYA